MKSKIRSRPSPCQRSAFNGIWIAPRRTIPHRSMWGVPALRRLPARSKRCGEFSTLAPFPVAKPQPADINDVIENALSLFNGRLDGIDVHKSLAADLPRVMADTEAIKRAVANLVDNAAEASQDSVVREIEISTSRVATRDAVEMR